MSSNTHGFKNEKEICEGLNNPRGPLKQFVEYIAEEKNLDIDEEEELKAEHLKDPYKSDIIIYIDGKSFGISVKRGSSNSVHQEPIGDFLEYIKENKNINGTSNDISRYFKWFIDSKKVCSQLKEEYPGRIEKLRKFLEKNKKVLAERFVKRGQQNEKEADFIYHGTREKGTWGEINKSIKVAISLDNPYATLPIGSLTLQAWNRKNENKRHVLQVKWGRMEKDLNTVRNSM